MELLMLFNHNPYDGSDIAWNALRLAEQLLNKDVRVRVFLMNDSVDLARDATKPPQGYFDLGKMLMSLIQKGVPVKVCGTCKARCGIHKGESYFEGAREAKMAELADWIKECDETFTF